jgi:hypothetical protein
MDHSARRRITALRLASQSLGGNSPPAPSNRSATADVVHHMLAMQAQDFPGAKWSIGARVPGSTDAAIESSLAAGEIVRSWPVRGTLHFVAPEDLRWMLRISAPRHANGAAKRRRDLEITDRQLARAGEVAVERMTGRQAIRRDELLQAWEASGISTAGQRGYHLLWNLGHSGLIVFGPVEGKQPTFVLLDEWIVTHRNLEGEEALREFAVRYFRARGPATVRDFAWWASITLADATKGLASAMEELESREFDGTTYYLARDVEPAPRAVRALPGFDEYLLGYQDRSAALAPEHADRIAPGSNGIFLPTILVDGAVVGTWKRKETATKVSIEVIPFETLTKTSVAGFARQMARYGEFLGKAVEVHN